MATTNNIEDFFVQFNDKINRLVPQIIAETANEEFKENFRRKSFEGVAWQETARKVKKGSLMVRSGALLNSVLPSVVSAALVRMSAGNSKVPYAQAHNEGSLITRSARSEAFVRNRVKSGTRKGQFKRGTKSGQGMSFKEFSYNMPKRQFMGRSSLLNEKIKQRIQGALNN